MNILTESQKLSFTDDGYLHIKDVLTENELRDCLLALHELFDLPIDQEADKDYFATFAVNKSDAILSIIDSESFFPYVLDIMGPFVQLTSSHVLIRPGRSSGFEAPIHVDGGACMESVIPNTANKPLQIKVQLFLTDLNEENAGNFILTPQSHTKDFPFYDQNRLGLMRGESIQIKARKGDIVIFSNNLWHSAVKNVSDHDRKSIILGYSQIFLRPYDYTEPTELLLSRATSRQKLLLGDIGYKQPQARYYPPSDFISKIENVNDFSEENLLNNGWTFEEKPNIKGSHFDFLKVKGVRDDFVTWDQMDLLLGEEDRENVCYANYADAFYLLENQQLIPKNFEGQNLIFPGSFIRSQTGHYHYPLLSFKDSSWSLSMYWVLFEFHDTEVAVLKRS